VARGERLVRVRMYSNMRQMWHGLTRLAALSLRWSGPGAFVTALFTAATAAPLGMLVSALLARRDLRRPLLVWLVACVGVFPWAWRLQSVPLILLAPLGAAFVQAAAIWGIMTRLFGLRLRWKDRPL
jgi:hypothetical protein